MTQISAHFEAEGLYKRFGAVQALNGLNFTLACGEVHAVLGENGAGKSTLIKLMSGVFRPDAGTMHLDGKLFAPRSPASAMQNGIALIPQELRVVPSLSIAENLFLGAWPTSTALGLLPRVDTRTMHDRAEHALSRLGVALNPRRLMGSLSFAERQMVIIARALERDASVLILDEPTAALERRETNRLFDIIDALRRNQTAILFVSHRLNEVDTIADRVTVIRDGKVVSGYTRGNYTREQIVYDMTGRNIHGLLQAAEIGWGSPVQSIPVDGVLEGGAVLHEKQILGLAGLIGSGSGNILLNMFGATPSKKSTYRCPADAISAGLGYVPDERARGLVLGHSVRDNIILPHLDAFQRWGRMDDQAVDALVEQLIDLVDLRPKDASLQVRGLSGGNQQKVAFARWLAGRVKVLLLDEPTHGIDVAAKTQIYHIIRDFVKKGGAVVLNSAEFHELLELSDSVLAVRRGEIAAELVRGRPDYSEARLRTELEG